MKFCNTCKKDLPEDSFYKRTYKSGKVKLQPKCKSCQNSRRAKYYKPHENIRRSLNISDEYYTTLLKRCEGRCEVCNRPIDKLCIDHCHSTNKVRGVLCNNCNTALGLVGDSKETLTKLIQWLELGGPQE